VLLISLPSPLVRPRLPPSPDFLEHRQQPLLGRWFPLEERNAFLPQYRPSSGHQRWYAISSFYRCERFPPCTASEGFPFQHHCRKGPLLRNAGTCRRPFFPPPPPLRFFFFFLVSSIFSGNYGHPSLEARRPTPGGRRPLSPPFLRWTVLHRRQISLFFAPTFFRSAWDPLALRPYK